MDRILILMRLLREISVDHVRNLGGYRFELLLANDQALVALINGDLQSVMNYADKAFTAYAVLELPDNCSRTAHIIKSIRYSPAEEIRAA